MFKSALTIDYFTDIEEINENTPESFLSEENKMIINNVKEHISHVEFYIEEAKKKINDYKKVCHSLKLDLISIRERHYFDKNQLTPDLLNILEKIKKKFALVSLQEDLKQIELQKSLKELISDRYSLENEVILCNSKIDYLESKIGCYGEYFNNKISSNKVQKKRLKSL